MEDKYIIVFDGVCNFCNFWVNLLMDRDKNDIFRFASLQSEPGREIIRQADFGPVVPDSFILKIKDNFYIKSTAGLLVAKRLGFPFNLLYPFIVLPRALRDFIYDLIAKNRYSLFGKSDSCRLPTPEEKQKFL